MKGMSVFQIVLISTFAAIAVAAVLIFAFAIGKGDSNAVGAVRIWGALDENAISTVLRQGAEADSTLSGVTYQGFKPETFESEVTNALASGQGPDLFLLRQDYAYADMGKVVGLPETAITRAQFETIFSDAALPFLAADSVLAIPLVVDPLVLYWNKDMLSTAGYAQAPLYWDEVSSVVKSITKRTESGSITKSAFALGEYANVNSAKYILAALIMQAGGEITARDESGNLIPALAVRTTGKTQSTQNALRFFTGFADPSQPNYTWNRALPEARKAFAAGDLALYIGFASEEPLVRQMNPNLNFAVAGIPQIRGAARAVTTGYVYGLAIPRTSRNPNGAAATAFTLSNVTNSKALSLALGLPSARRDVLSQPTTGDDAIFAKQAIITRSWIDPSAEKTENIFRAMIENTVSGATLVTEAVQRADQELAELLGR